MSYVSLDNLSDVSLITQFIIEYRGRGHFLPYTEHKFITKWLDLAGNTDNLLLILADIVPDFYARHATRMHPPSLQRIDRKVSQILHNQFLRS